MDNVEMNVEGTILTIKVDLSKDFGPSKSQKTIIIATTKGNVSVPGNDKMKIGLNIYRYKDKEITMLGSLLRYFMPCLGSIYSLSANYGTSDNINIHQINRARRKFHRGKMYRRFRNQPTRGMRVKARA